MSKSPLRKPLYWIGSSRKDLSTFPVDIKKTMGFALAQAQEGGRHFKAKSLRGFGSAGVTEIVDESESGAFRLVYTVSFAETVYVLHCFQKKSKHGIETPKREIDLIKARLREAAEHYRDRISGSKP